MSRLILAGIGDPAQNVRLDKDPDLTLGADDVLLKMEASPINPVDYLFSNSWYAVQPQIPSFIGSEGVGHVVETGSAADRSLVGKRVVVLGTYEQGVWADTVAVPARNVVVVPEDVDAHQLSMAVINPLTAHLMLKQYVDLKPGDWIGQTLGNSAVARAVIEKAVGEIVGFIARGELSVPVDSTYPLDRYGEALARHGSPERTGKVLFTFGKPEA
jgi:NADPH:quinone reductase-like Zn-dependent oxidoreductase